VSARWSRPAPGGPTAAIRPQPDRPRPRHANVGYTSCMRATATSRARRSTAAVVRLFAARRTSSFVRRGAQKLADLAAALQPGLKGSATRRPRETCTGARHRTRSGARIDTDMSIVHGQRVIGYVKSGWGQVDGPRRHRDLQPCGAVVSPREEAVARSSRLSVVTSRPERPKGFRRTALELRPGGSSAGAIGRDARIAKAVLGQDGAGRRDELLKCIDMIKLTLANGTVPCIPGVVRYLKEKGSRFREAAALSTVRDREHERAGKRRTRLGDEGVAALWAPSYSTRRLRR